MLFSKRKRRSVRNTKTNLWVFDYHKVIELKTCHSLCFCNSANIHKFIDEGIYTPFYIIVIETLTDKTFPHLPLRQRQAQKSRPFLMSKDVEIALVVQKLDILLDGMIFPIGGVALGSVCNQEG